MKVLSLFVVCAGIILAGCSSAPSETAPADKPAESATTSQNALPEGVTVASDNVVRNAAGEAYCVVMKQTISKEQEAEMPKTTKDGVTYTFCCKSCPPMFDKDPAKYAVAKN